MVKTAIVILNWNGIKYLKMFLGRVIEFSLDPDTVLYVADNGSTDGSTEWIDSTFSDVKIIRFEKNHGFAGGYNLALAQIEARYFVLLNSDIEVTPGWLQPLVNQLDSNPDVASCQPKVLSFSKRDHFEYAGAAGGFIDRLGYPLCRGRILFEIEKDTGQYDTPSDIFWSTGACMVVRSDLWRQCGGFDEGFFAHMEEIDLCWRFHRSGYRVTCVPGSVVYHVGGGALPYDSPFKTYLNFRNSLYLLYKNLPERTLSGTMLKRKFLDGVTTLFFLAKGQFRSTRAVWRAHMDFYKNLGDLKEKRKAAALQGENEYPDLILNKSVIFEFYIRNHRTFGSLGTNL